MENDLLLKPILNANLKSQVEREVRNAILRGVFKPGERLIESTIAEQLGVSRAPLREVFAALEREGLVVNIPRRGNFVVDFTDKDIEEIYSLRLLLEQGALRRAMPRLKDEDFKQMQKLVDQLGDTGQSPVGEVAIETDLAFHEYICYRAEHTRLYGFWKSISTQTSLLIGLTTQTFIQEPFQPQRLHQEILDAIISGDIQLAEERLCRHLEDAQSRASQVFGKIHSDLSIKPGDAKPKQSIFNFINDRS